jgi:hypothetical protein
VTTNDLLWWLGDGEEITADDIRRAINEASACEAKGYLCLVCGRNTDNHLCSLCERDVLTGKEGGQA